MCTYHFRFRRQTSTTLRTYRPSLALGKVVSISRIQKPFDKIAGSEAINPYPHVIKLHHESESKDEGDGHRFGFGSGRSIVDVDDAFH
jgi:hypothetical protein